MKSKNFGLRLKNLTESGTFTGLGAVYGNVDQGGDRILPGAFTKTLADNGGQFPLLWQHDPSKPIGSVTLTDSPTGLQVQAQLLMTNATAKEAYDLLKAKVIKGLSIGYDTKQANYTEDGVRDLKELKLYELSVVTFPMNESAQVLGIKAMSQDEQSEHVTAINEHRKAIDRHQRAMHEHLKAMLEGFDDDDDAGDDVDIVDAGDFEEMSRMIEELKAMAAAETA